MLSVISDQDGNYVPGSEGTRIRDLLTHEDLSPSVPTITSPDDAVGWLGQPFDYGIKTPFPTSAYEALHLPCGLNLESTTGVISGEPCETGIFRPLLRAKGGGLTAQKQVTFIITPTAEPEATAQNISTRMTVGSGADVLIGGFIIQGNAPKQVMIRAIGPSLAAAGVNGALEDPTLELLQRRHACGFERRLGGERQQTGNHRQHDSAESMHASQRCSYLWSPVPTPPCLEARAAARGLASSRSTILVRIS